jgi:uncharacterized protein YkwD
VPPALAKADRIESTPADKTPDLERVGKLVTTQTNQFRKEKGRKELKVNRKLTEAAQHFAEYLAQTDKFSHTADGSQPWERAAKAGYDYCIVAENIAYEYNSAGFTSRELGDAFVTGWKNSPEHRKNLLDPDVVDIGVARSKRTGRYYAVQDFGRPKSMALSFKVSNETESTLHYTVGGKKFELEPRYTRTHERCRPADVVFSLTAGKQGTVFHPQKGDHYFVRQGRAGKLRIDQE